MPIVYSSAFSDRWMDDGGPQPRGSGIDFGRRLGEIRVVAGVGPLSVKAGKAGKALPAAHSLNVFIQDLVRGRGFGVGLLRNVDIIGIAVGRRAVLLRQTWREPRSYVAAMTCVARDGAHASEILGVDLLHHQQHLARGLLDGSIFGIFRGVTPAILSVAIEAVQTQGSGDEAHRGHEFVHWNSPEHLDVLEDL